jgi:hypothetical protein
MTILQESMLIMHNPRKLGIIQKMMTPPRTNFLEKLSLELRDFLRMMPMMSYVDEVVVPISIMET